MIMYKFLSGFLVVALVAAGSAYGFERWKHGNTRKDLNNKLAKAQKMQQETESAYSRLAIESENIKATNTELQSVIEDRDEEVLALANANIRLKNKVVRIENAKQTIVDSDGNVVVPDGTMSDCKNRIRVDFEKEEDPLKISGHTLTNPAYAEVKIDWLRELKIEVVLTKNDDDTYRIYIDSGKSDIMPTDLTLQVDPTILEYSWYEKIGFGSSVTGGETGLQLSISAFYDVIPNLAIGPMFQVGYVNGKAATYYGVIVSWWPWK